MIPLIGDRQQSSQAFASDELWKDMTAQQANCDGL